MSDTQVNNETSVPIEKTADDQPKQEKPDPTRYGDWEKSGRCIDF